MKSMFVVGSTEYVEIMKNYKYTKAIHQQGPILYLKKCSSQCSTTGVTKAAVCTVLPMGWCT